MTARSHTTMRAAGLLVAGLVVAGAAAVRPDGGAPPEATAAALQAALERALAEPAARRSLRLLAECQRDGILETLELYGGGVAIANRRLQLEVPPAAVAGAIEALLRHRFAAMPETFGGGARDPARPSAPGAERGAAAAVRVVCRVELRLAGLSHAVLQLAKGHQSPALRALALELLRLGAEAAAEGIRATDLADGLRSIAEGRLAPQALRLLLHRRPDHPSEGHGVLLRIDGADATARAFHASSGYGPAQRLTLGAGEVRRLAAELARADVAAMPANLWSTVYTDLSLAVLEHEVSIQARRFEGLGPSTHGETQRAFDRLQAQLDELARRVLAEERATGGA